MRFLFTLLSAALSAALLAAPALGGAHKIDLNDVAQVDILRGWQTESGTQMTALRVRLAPGWKTYWRAPGEGGIPPRFDWEGSQNLTGVAFHWPTPEVFHQNGMRSIGFEGQLVLPMELVPATPGQPIQIRATLEIGVCEDICIPMQLPISADVGGAGGPDARISSALNARPDTARQAGLRTIRCRIEPISDGLRLTATLTMPALGPSEDVVFELPDQSIWVAEAVTQRQDNTLTTMTELVPPSGAPFLLDRSQVRITVLSRGRGAQIEGCPGG